MTTFPNQDTVMEAFTNTNDEAHDASSTHLVPPPSTGEEESPSEEKEQVNMDAPWSEDWTKLAADRLNQALEGYKEHAKCLFQAISAFVDESNAVHAEWHSLHQAELAESQRLDEVEPDVFQATAVGGGEPMYGNGFAGRDPSSRE